MIVASCRRVKQIRPGLTGAGLAPVQGEPWLDKRGEMLFHQDVG